ncbi:signal peptidase I [Pirellula staleyi DSM 6068]|uniref:Signal peptidase I n=1 Tax=Pirellula staleyi (strain ATCC 27377 / DSM 6068 / ICPB 4128) TaxID=530564 RepID=D2R168_PIRSD|nr:signal peptidase I [Pirellula staleyi]ADB18553.1 signal peptidase I [Pirellula staleyi DSM 6068]
MTTFVLIATLVLLLLLSIALRTFFLRVGLRWAIGSSGLIRPVVLTSVAIHFLEIASYLFVVRVVAVIPGLVLVAGLAQLALLVAVSLLGIGIAFRLTMLGTLKAWLPTLIANLLMGLITVLLIKPLMLDAYIISSNSMAPTLLGRHLRGTCPECGAASHCSPNRYEESLDDSPPNAICEHFHIQPLAGSDSVIQSADRVIAASYLAPRRWDLIVYRSPANPAQQYTMRLVGLPGETVMIQEGELFINGQKCEKPASLSDLKLSAEVPDYPGPISGSAENPALLKEDEYFVVGDFHIISYDSRMWETGAAGHPSYAVPRSYITGVVTHTYWPLRRAKIHR